MKTVGVGRQVAARVVADEQHRPVLGDVAQAPDLAAEVQAGQQPQPRQLLADVVGVALVEVGGAGSGAGPATATPRTRRVGRLRARPRLAPSGGRPLLRACLGERLRSSRLASPSATQAAARPARTPARRARRRCGEEAPRAARWSARAARPGGRGRRPRARSARRSGSQSLDVAPEAGGDEPVVRAPHEQRRRLRARRAAGRSRRGRRAGRGRCCAPRRGRRGARRPTRRCAGTRPRRRRRRSGRRGRGRRTGPRTGRATVPRAEAVGQEPELGAQERARAGGSRAARRPRPGTAAPSAAHALGRGEPDLDRHPAAHRVADQVGALDPERVHRADHGAGEPAARRSGAVAGLLRRAEARAGRSRARGSGG